MTGDRSEAAVQRIEAALARIARAAEAPLPPGGTAPAANVIALVEKHERLRDNIAQAVADLDKLIGELEP